MTERKPDISSTTVDANQRLHVEAELERILQSPGFRTSKRSQEFLRYIVITSLDGRFEELKERVIGNQVFQRLPDYDTGEHSIVRVKANELRKRLAQFYSETREKSALEIHLPKGSYTPEYRWIEIDDGPAPAPPLAPEEQQSPSRLWPWLVAGGIVLSILCLVSWHFVHEKLSPSVVEQFWQPVLQDANAPLLCTGSPDVWKLNDRSEALASQGALPATIPSSELIHDVNHYVGWGDTLALTQLTEFFANHYKDPQIQLANDVSFSELSHSPVILIGARSNSWTMQLANNMRFVFEQSDEGRFLRDNAGSGKTWMFEQGPPKVDYVVISRIFESKTGRMIVLAAGLSHYGTQVAGKILTDPVSLRKALQNAPKDWNARNMQLVFRVEIFGSSAGEPVLEASNFW
jgi:hypothetical protein